MSEKAFFKDQPEIKYTKIFINNEWVDSGKGTGRWVFFACSCAWDHKLS